MGLKEWIIPQDRVFFEWLSEAARNDVACAQALVDLFTSYDGLAERRQHIKDLEHKGDSITHNIFEGLGRSFILPLDREDISGLAQALDDIADFVYAATNRLYLYEIRKATPEMRKFAEILLAQTKELVQAVTEIRSPKTHQATVKHAIEVHRLENEADRLLNEAVGGLFRGSDPIHIMKHKEIYEILETATDKCEDAADVLSDIVRKHG
jgi:uncharacterized protein